MTKKAEPEKGPARDSLLKYLLLAIGGYFVDLVLPAVLGMTAWYLVAGSVGLWKLSRALFVVLFFVLFLAVCLLCYGLLRTLINWRKRILPRIRQGWADNPQKRLLDIALFGLAVPIAIALAANLVPVSSGDALLATLERRWTAGAPESTVGAVANVSLTSSSPETKRQVVETLQAMGSEVALRELFRLLQDDPEALDDFGYYTAMRSALASFGDAARDEIQGLLRERSEIPEAVLGGPAPGLYDAFFAAAFDTLREEIAANAAQPDATDALLLAADELRVDLARGLERLEEQGGLAMGGDPVLNLALDTLVELGPGENDKAAYRQAHLLAEDETRASTTRARALQLVAVLGSGDDVPFLVDFLEGEDPLLQRSALEAIAILHGRE